MAHWIPACAMTEVVRARSLWRDAAERLAANRAALAAAAILVVIAVLALAAPLLASHPYDKVYFDRTSMPPDFARGHWFGTDANGRDLFARVLMGGRMSLAVGLIATSVAMIIGVTWGAIAGYLGGRVDALMMRAVDIAYALPFMFFVILLMVFFGRHVWLIFVAIGCVEWLTMARIVRGQTLSLKRREFVEAARAAGVGDLAIVRRHIVPNALGPIIVYATLTVPHAILIESFISFLGLGVQEPNTSWGVLIAEGAKQMETEPWTLLFPATFLAVTLFCFNFLGDGLRDALDPKERRR